MTSISIDIKPKEQGIPPEWLEPTKCLTSPTSPTLSECPSTLGLLNSPVKESNPFSDFNDCHIQEEEQVPATAFYHFLNVTSSMFIGFR
jgi:hypothetical protein